MKYNKKMFLEYASAFDYTEDFHYSAEQSGRPITWEQAKKIHFSAQQIAFHLTHPNNSFIMLKTLGPLAIKLFEGRFIEDLIKGKADPCATDMESSFKFLQKI